VWISDLDILEDFGGSKIPSKSPEELESHGVKSITQIDITEIMLF